MGNSTSYEYIESVSFESISNTSGNNSGYADFTNLSAAVNPGQTYMITLEPGFTGASYTEYWTVFVDLDSNGDFSGADENLYTGSSKTSITASITIPTGPYIGNVVMRVAMQYNSAPPACGTFTYGEVEDYTLSLTPACAVGSPCDDGNSCTTNDAFNSSCECVGTPVADSDGDGICDENDICPNFDDNLIGTPCDDGDVCTIGETYDINCGCSGGTTSDSDQDGICDGLDLCPNLDDNLIGTSCNDNDACTTNDVYTTDCGCAGTPANDADNDGVCDANDLCPNFDDNLIGTACDDNDACTTGETYDANCGCSGGIFTDTDDDGVCDANDECPGSDDSIDTNGNGVPDGCDNCPAYNFNNNPIIGYDPGQDLGNYEIQDNGATVFIEKNSWKALSINYTVTPNTVLTFDFKSTIEGEIHEISFDNNLSLSPSHRFVLYGTQGYNGDYNIPKYTSAGEWQSMSIAIGDLFTGDYTYLVLTADDDNKVAGNSYFRNITLFEDLNGDFLCDESCQVGSSCDDGDPCTTGESYDSLCGCTGGISGTDSDSDGICDILDQCPGFDDNLIGTACDDGDTCTEGEIYDAECGCSGGTYIDNDQDGYCVGEDPNDNDPCTPDNSGCADCTEFDFNDFENNLGIWNDGGSDCYRGSNFASFSKSGTAAVRIRDNSGLGSSLYSDVLDLSSYEGIEVNFSFFASSMEANEDFFLEVSTNGGNTFELVGEWNSGVEFVNNQRYDISVNIDESLLSTSTVIRFRCDASANSDRIYLDDIQIETCGSASFKAQPLLRSSAPKNQTATLRVYPNPVKNDLFLELNDIYSDKMETAKVITSFGQVVKEFKMDRDRYARLDVSDLDGGQTYLIIIQTTDGASFIEKFIKV